MSPRVAPSLRSRNGWIEPASLRAGAVRSNGECGRASRSASGAALTAGTIEGAAPSLDDSPDRAPTRAARLSFAVVDEQLLAVGARLVPERAIRAEGGAHSLDGFVQHAPGLARHRIPFLASQTSGRAARIDTGAMQDLARVDVPDAGETLLIQEEDLHRDRGAAGRRLEALGGRWRGDRIGSELGERRIFAKPRGRRHPEESEAARILEPQLGAVTK